MEQEDRGGRTEKKQKKKKERKKQTPIAWCKGAMVPLLVLYCFPFYRCKTVCLDVQSEYLEVYMDKFSLANESKPNGTFRLAKKTNE
jgi:hypothetical protein